MRRILFRALLASLCLIAIAAQPPAAVLAQSPDQAAALQAATAWLVHLDAGDNIAVAQGYSEEVIALIGWPKHEDKVAAIAVLLNQPRSDTGIRKVTRTLRPEDAICVGVRFERNRGWCSVSDNAWPRK
jgi:hypothetical protein